MNGIALIAFLAVLVERLIEYFVAPWADKLAPPMGTIVMRGLSLFGGIGVAIIFKVNAFALIGLTAIVPDAAVILTGVVIGGGANLVNDLFDGHLFGTSHPSDMTDR